jgi:DNA replication protein DnaD
MPKIASKNQLTRSFNLKDLILNYKIELSSSLFNKQLSLFNDSELTEEKIKECAKNIYNFIKINLSQTYLNSDNNCLFSEEEFLDTIKMFSSGNNTFKLNINLFKNDCEIKDNIIFKNKVIDNDSEEKTIIINGNCLFDVETINNFYNSLSLISKNMICVEMEKEQFLEEMMTIKETSGKLIIVLVFI